MERLDKMFSEDLLNKVKEILDEGKKQVDEAVEVSHTRYLRSHGKKASGRGPWMFTHKLYGDAKGDDTFAAPSSAKSFSDATKHAKEWAKSKGHRTVYVMEEVEQIDEVGDTVRGRKALAKYINKAAIGVHNAAYIAGRKEGEKSGYDTENLTKGMKRQVGIHRASKRLSKEEVEQIDELSKQTMKMYHAKASQDRGEAKKDKEYAEYRFDPAGKAQASDTIRKRSAGIKMVRNKLKTEEVEQIDEVSPKSAINAYIRRKSRADDFYSEPDDEEKAEKTLSRIDKKYGSASKIAKGARHGVEIDQKGRGHQGGPGDYLDAKQGVYKGFAKPTTKKGTKQRLHYMNLNKGRFKEEVEHIDEAAFDAASKANDRHYEKQTERVKNMLDKYAMRGMSYRDAVKKISGPSHILRNEITPLREEAELDEADEGWYAHNEMHGKVSREDWKKGWRYNHLKDKPFYHKPTQTWHSSIKEEVEDLDEMNYRDSGYQNMLKASIKADRIAAKDKARREKMEAQKKGKQEVEEEAEDLDEGRGRPPKEGSEAWKRRQAAAEKGEDEGESEHIIASLRKASHNMTGRGAVKFKSGIEMVDREHARRAVSKYMDHRTPDEKDEYLDKISHSYGHLKKNI